MEPPSFSRTFSPTRKKERIQRSFAVDYSYVIPSILSASRKTSQEALDAFRYYDSLITVITATVFGVLANGLRIVSIACKFAITDILCKRSMRT